MVESDRHNAAYDNPQWRRRSRQAIARHRARVGDWCPGYLVMGHPSKELTADHPDPLARGGSLLDQDLDVLCVSCNSRKKARRVA